MRDYDDAKALADSIVRVANGAGLPTVGLLTDMNQVLGRTAGNAVEVVEAVEYLKNHNINPRLHKITVELTAELLVIGKLAKNVADARKKIEAVIVNGKAVEHFAKMVAKLGGPRDFVEKTAKYLKPAKIVRDFHPVKKGKVAALDVFKIGIGIVEMGGGRARPSDKIDYSVGLTNVAQVGEQVGKGYAPLATIHAKDEASWKIMAKTLEDALAVSAKANSRDELVKARITA
jgi:thymidine phosphorylase